MAYGFDGTDDDVRFSPGALVGYTPGPVTVAALINRNATGSWDGVVCISDVAGSDGGGVLLDAIEFDPTSHLAFWNGRTVLDISGAAATALSDTTNWWVVVLTWGGASTAPRYHWKQLGSGSWTHESIADSTGGDSQTVASGDAIIIGTDPTGGDDLSADVVWAGVKKADSGDSVTSLDTTSWSTVIAFGWDWLVGFQASGTLSDQTGGGGNETSRSGTTLTSDPGGWDWSTGAAPTAPYVPRRMPLGV